MARNIVPRTNKGADLGTPAKNWNTVYADSVVANSVQGGNLGAVEQSAGDEVTLRSLITNAGSDPISVTVYDDIPITTTDLTIPSNVHLKFKDDGKLSPASGITLTVNGSVDASLWQIFGGDGTTKIGNKNIMVFPQWFGAVGDGATDDTESIQKTFDCFADAGGVVYFNPGTYLVARTLGTNDHYGLTITKSNITIDGHNAYLKRYNTDISTDSLAYPILFIGTPDSNSANPTESIVVRNIGFIGEDTRHDLAGNAPHDFRTAIECKNTNDVKIFNCIFSNIDSVAVYMQRNPDYDIVNSVWYNTTKNYNLTIKNCKFAGAEHTTDGRSLIHAVYLAGVDHAWVDSNYFEWCDNAVSGEGTYATEDNDVGSTWTPDYSGWTLGDVERTGRFWTVCNNVIYNSSEHALYLSGVDVNIHNNKVYSNSAYCHGNIKVRSRGVIVKGNTVNCDGICISVGELSRNVLISDNLLYSNGDTTGGVISFSSNGLSSWIENRAFVADYYQMENINITNNTIVLPETAAPQTNYHYGIRFYASLGDSNYPDGEMVNINITNNILKNCRSAIVLLNEGTMNVLIADNMFIAKPFSKTSFSGSTTMNSWGILQGNKNGSLMPVIFRNNYIEGAKYIFCTETGTSGLSLVLPRGISNNYFSYIQNISTSDMNYITVSNGFTGNTGFAFMDRTVVTTSINNALGDGSTFDSFKRTTFQWTGNELRFYKDDSGGYVVLG